ncbi:histidine phosphotransferase family protein [Sulfitobacter sp. S190]|uniref:histidine phosphotransferase family protein n=1 Tax=Sulfitobacter sp. S190 TaxID=2867022 RepID=UPI0021A8DE1D|nr:histidine phosphotransferase family protein [Sulfitobacter sp. S190]UWR23958.1 histidine phosphotransferase [Sulfitobacter sp. S190]
MPDTQTTLAALIGSRICHDLISPIGAINNGIELIGMSETPGDAEIELISESVNNASARIRFFRIAFGAAGDQEIGRAEVTAVLRDVYESSRLTVAWGPMDPQPRKLVRLCFLGLMCLESGMPYGGRIEITRIGAEMELKGHADKLNVDPDLWAYLARREVPDGLKPSHVQFGLLPAIAAEAGRRILLTTDAAHITMRF